jgi:type I restriction enzyme S subunit
LDEQQEIVDILEAIDRKIDLHKRKRALLDDLFKALLHKLMTGEIRVVDLDLSALGSAPLHEAAA